MATLADPFPPRRSDAPPKRDSVPAHPARAREDAARRYPSPPLPSPRHSPQPLSLEASLAIPPYNPHPRRSQPPTRLSNSATTSHSDPSATHEARDRLPSMPHRASVALPPTAHSHLAQQLPSAARSRQSVQVLPSQSYPSPTPLYTSSSAAVAAALAAAPLSSAGPYPTLYQPHPMPKQKVYFGPYILLQTLGEGEFGKVKLGVHSEKWGEEVAIKLIKRGNVDTKLRGEKVRREIEVLKVSLLFLLLDSLTDSR